VCSDVDTYLAKPSVSPLEDIIVFVFGYQSFARLSGSFYLHEA
jgi:hypothetical protein